MAILKKKAVKPEEEEVQEAPEAPVEESESEDLGWIKGVHYFD